MPSLAVVLGVLVFGWTGGNLVVGQSYTDAKPDVAEQKLSEPRKAEERAERTR